MKKIIFLTTYRDISLFNNLYQSINKYCKNPFTIISVHQQKIYFDKINIINNIIKISAPHVSLSKARNIGLEYIYDNDIYFDFILFPDDDSTYDEGLFDYIEILDVSKSYLIGVKNDCDKKEFRKQFYFSKKLNKYNFNLACSVNMIINRSILKKHIKFDENLGIGSMNGSSEDLDFYYRMNDFSKFEYNNKLYSLHPKIMFNELNKILSYTDGYVYFLKKHNIFYFFIFLLFRNFIAINLAFLKLDKKLITYNFKLLKYRLNKWI